MRFVPLLLAAALVALVAGGLGAYARHAAVPRDAFADRAVEALHAGAVRSELADRITDRVLAEQPELVQAGGRVRAVVGGVVADAAFAPILRRAAGDVHDALLNDPDAPVRLRLAGSERRVRAALIRREPALAGLPLTGDATVTFEDAQPVGRALDAGRRLGRAAPAALVAAAALLALTAAAARSRRGVVLVGLTVTIAGGLIVAGTFAGRAIAVGQVTTPHDKAVVGALWDAYLADLRTWGIVAAAAGLGVAALAGALRGRQYRTAAR